jgi:uncharacterized membrane protein
MCIGIIPLIFKETREDTDIDERKVVIFEKSAYKTIMSFILSIIIFWCVVCYLGNYDIKIPLINFFAGIISIITLPFMVFTTYYTKKFS